MKKEIKQNKKIKINSNLSKNIPTNYFQKLEEALQRAQKFISDGTEQDALQSLHDMIKV